MAILCALLTPHTIPLHTAYHYTCCAARQIVAMLSSVHFWQLTIRHSPLRQGCGNCLRGIWNGSQRFSCQISAKRRFLRLKKFFKVNAVMIHISLVLFTLKLKSVYTFLLGYFVTFGLTTVLCHCLRYSKVDSLSILIVNYIGQYKHKYLFIYLLYCQGHNILS